MSKSLSQLKKALVGEIAMSNELDALGTVALQRPAADDVAQAHAADRQDARLVDDLPPAAAGAVQGWVDEGEPKVMWLSGLSIPETYTAALVQTTCRRYGWPLDKTTLYTKVTKFTQVRQVRSA